MKRRLDLLVLTAVLGLLARWTWTRTHAVDAPEPATTDVRVGMSAEEASEKIGRAGAAGPAQSPRPPES